MSEAIAIVVNGTSFDENAIHSEMQYHTGENQRDVLIKASEALIISELLKQKAQSFGINTEGDFTEELFSQDLDLPDPDQEECLNYFNNNQKKFTTSPLLNVRHILLPSHGKEGQNELEQQDLAEFIITKLNQDPQCFTDLVRQYSICPSAETQGQLGQISRGQTTPEFENQVFNCKEGLIQTPVRTRYGFHIVHIEKRIDGKALEFSMVNEKIRDYLKERVKRKAIAQYIHQLIVEAEISGYDFSVSSTPLIQ